MSNRYDIAIIGSGPAGLSAAINAKIRNKKIIVFGNEQFSNKLIKAPRIDNYLGFHGIKGQELKEQFANHIKAMDIKINFERVNNVYAMGDYFALMAGDNNYEAKTVILATGIEFTRPLKGEEEFLGRGVGYCATCDAPLYRNKVVSIIGYNKEAEEEANFVSELAAKVYYVPMYNGVYNIKSTVELVKDTPLEVIGDLRVRKLVLKNREIETDGVFPLKDSVPPSQLVPGLEMEDGHIKVDRHMQTNIPGCFACGDCVGRPYAYMKSAGEGQVAALRAVNLLDNRTK
ncbi:NAD(P)/FAD-dependent oxidoreductase [Haloimpatiens lingqiaonensis]|uniref:NAD(P)/FAD-dependent oxidoreductase n=1 Tax=Haloimpatiens lingqiaonensis TaxID=1380675 RepID=UPI0010FEC21C|nr:NAD(P)/FAD-dependent oxidoreductase [Haloimpatiens lingqiaonensis]